MDDFSAMRCMGGGIGEFDVPGKLGTTSVNVGCSSGEESVLGVLLMLIESERGAHESE